MWNGTKYAAMAIAGATLAAAISSPASAQHLDSRYAGVYSFGWPFAPLGAGDYGPNSAYGYGGSYRSASYGGQEGDRGAYVTTMAPAPARPRPVIHRCEPKRLE
jgi:hypothetical protein